MSEHNNVIISIRGRQSFAGMEDDTIELVTEGRLRRDKGSYTLSYQETEVTGMENTLTTIRVEGDRVTLMREGRFNSQMVFQEGRRHLSLYETPYGALEVGINTKRMRSALDDKGGELEIDYRLEVDHRVAGMNLFQISVREKRPGAIAQ